MLFIFWINGNILEFVVFGMRIWIAPKNSTASATVHIGQSGQWISWRIWVLFVGPHRKEETDNLLGMISRSTTIEILSYCSYQYKRLHASY
jgi:hypothetical protein